MLFTQFVRGVADATTNATIRVMGIRATVSSFFILFCLLALWNLFVYNLDCLSRFGRCFRTGVIGGARGFIMVSSYIAKTPSGGLYSDVIVLVNYYYGNWSAKFPKN